MQAEDREKESPPDSSAFPEIRTKKNGPGENRTRIVIFPAEQRTFRHPNDLICR